jgi:hypothetical protein
MKRRRSLIQLGAALALVLGAAAEAHAAFVPWSYNWEPGSTFVSSTTGSGRLYTSDEALGHAEGASNIVITNLRTASTAQRDHPDVFTNAPFKASLTIIDGINGMHGSVSFTGVFNGTISAGSSDLGFTLTSAQKEFLTLGTHVYSVTFGRYAPPGPPSATNTGSIASFVSVRDSTQHAPEPSTALLTCLGGSFLGLASWWKRRQRRPAPGLTEI